EVRPWREAVEFRDAARERLLGVDLAIGERARRLDVQIGDLRDRDRARGHRRVHECSPGSRRMTSGSIPRPIRSPALTVIALDASTRIGLAAAPLTVSRWRSPMKLTASTWPVSVAPSGAVTVIASGRIIATTGPVVTLAAPFATGNRPPG